jgi:hypothetical protein
MLHGESNTYLLAESLLRKGFQAAFYKLVKRHNSRLRTDRLTTGDRMILSFVLSFVFTVLVACDNRPALWGLVAGV